MSLVRNNVGVYTMDLVDSVPISNLNSETVKMEMIGYYDYLDFFITDVNLTEPDIRHNPIITRIARKKKVNITISGHFTEKMEIVYHDPKMSDIDRPYNKYIDIQGKPINITFYGVRVFRELVKDHTDKAHNFPYLMVDNTHELYGFIKPIYVNQGKMSVLSEQNIYITFEELKELLKHSTVNLGVTDAGDNTVSLHRWITKCKKGDSNGETH